MQNSPRDYRDARPHEHCRGCIRLLIVEKRFPHYRSDLIRELLLADCVSVEFVHDSRYQPMLNPDGAISPIPEDVLCLVGQAPIRRLGTLLWQSNLVSRLLGNNLDAIILPGDPHLLSSFVLMLAARLRRRPKVFLWTHGWTRIDTPLRQFAKRIFFGLANGLLLYSERAVDIARIEGFPSKKLFVMGNSIWSSSRLPVLNNVFPSQTDNRFGIICVARLIPTKRLDLLLDALQKLSVIGGKPFFAIIVGDGPERARLAEQALAFGLDVRFAGAEYGLEALERLYASVDMCIVPEAAGLSVVQALGFGVPVVTHNDWDSQMPEAEAVREGLTGALYDKGSPPSLAAAIARCAQGISSGKITRATCRLTVESHFCSTMQAHRIVDSVKQVLHD